MSDECLVAVYENVALAEKAIHLLSRKGYPTSKVVLVTKHLTDQPELLEELKLDDDSLHDAAIGAGLGGVLGVLAGVTYGVLTAPAVAVFIIGTIAGMSSAVTGAIFGGLIGSVAHKDHLQHYETVIRKGRVLLVVHGNPLQLAQADQQLQTTNPREMHLHYRTSEEEPQSSNVL